MTLSTMPCTWMDIRSCTSQEAKWTWWTCIDFSDLNKKCPKDSFPLSKIDQRVNSMAGYKLLSIKDAYYGYNQIAMDVSSMKHTSFIVDLSM